MKASDMQGILVGYGRVITRQLWEAGGSAEVDLSSVPTESPVSEWQLALEAEGISTNLIDLWSEDIRLGIPVMELYVSVLFVKVQAHSRSLVVLVMQKLQAEIRRSFMHLQ